MMQIPTGDLDYTSEGRIGFERPKLRWLDVVREFFLRKHGFKNW